MVRDASEQHGSTEIPPPTQQSVLQAICDHFREHGAWPTFITIDRPIRRKHRWGVADDPPGGDSVRQDTQGPLLELPSDRLGPGKSRVVSLAAPGRGGAL